TESAVAEKAYGNLIAPAHLDRQSRAGSDASAAGDDRISTQVAGVLIGNVHGAAFAATIAGFFAEQFGEHFVERSALGDAMTMTSVGACDVIILPQCLANTDSHRFFPDIKMRQARHLRAEIKLIDLFFEQPDFQHLAVEVEPALVPVSAGRVMFCTF